MGRYTSATEIGSGERKEAEPEVALHLLVLDVDVEPERKKMDIWAEIGKDGIYDIRRELLESDHIWPLWLVCSMMRICGRRAGFWGRIFSFRQHVQPR